MGEVAVLVVDGTRLVQEVRALAAHETIQVIRQSSPSHNFTSQQVVFAINIGVAGLVAPACMASLLSCCRQLTGIQQHQQQLQHLAARY